MQAIAAALTGCYGSLGRELDCQAQLILELLGELALL
jgi:hypothetical protein